MSQGSQKLKILYLMKILLEETDETHCLGVQELITELERYGITSERKSIYSDLETLSSYGLDIQKVKDKHTKYYVGTRDFELAELKLLVDAIQSARFLTTKKSNELIEKLKKLASKHEGLSLQRQVFVANRPKSINEQIYYSVDTLHEAIAQKKRVRFQYFDYTVEKEKSFRKEGNFYYISPYSLLWDDENYYLIAYYEKYNNFVHYRVDRMNQVEIVDEPREALCEGQSFDVAEYAKKTFSMFGGEDERVELTFHKELVNQVLDRFGAGISLRALDSDHFAVSCQVKISGTFFSWIAQYGEKVKIQSPQEVKEQFIGFLENILKQY